MNNYSNFITCWKATQHTISKICILQSNLTLRPDVRDSSSARGHQDIERNFSKLLIFLREAFYLRLPQKLRESRQMHEVLIGWMNRECQKTGLKWIYMRCQNYWKVSLLHSSTHAEFRALHSKRHSSRIKWRGKKRRGGALHFNYSASRQSLQVGFSVLSLNLLNSLWKLHFSLRLMWD